MNDNAEHNSIHTDDFSISRYLKRYARYRLFFILSVIMSFLLAAVYLYWKTPLYRIQSSLVIKDEKKGEAISLTLKELDFLDQQKIIDNEAEIIRSESIIGRVVRSMNLNIGYYKKENLIQLRPLFDESPVELHVIQASGDLYREPLDISIKKNDEFVLNPGGITHRFGDTIGLRGAQILVTRSQKSSDLTGKIRVVVTDPEETTQQLRSTIAASAPSKSSSVLYVSMLYPSREKGVIILREIIKEYDKANLEEKKAQTDSIVKQIESRLALIGEQVKQLESKGQSVKTSQGITFLDDDARSLLEQANNYDKEYNDTRIQLDNIEKIEEYLSSNTAVVSPPNSSLNDPVLTNMITSLNQLELQKQALLRKSGPQHPSVLAVSRQAEDIKTGLKDNIRLQRGNLENKIILLEKSRGRISAGIGRVPGNERDLLELMREKNIRESIYSYLLEKREEASLSDAAVFSRMRLVDPPFSTIKPVKPKKIVILGTAVLCGLLFPIIVVAIKENSKVKVDENSLKSRLPYRVIGRIPKMKDFDYKSFTEPGSIVSEQFRWIQASLEKIMSKGDNNNKVILVSSPRDNEGKSFVSLNLAASFAAVCKKTVLLDFDLRKNKLTSLFSLSGSTEFARQMQSGDLDMPNLVRPVDSSGFFYIIGNDTSIDNSAALLDKAHLRDFFEWLRSNFDYVIINTPPFTYFTDAYKLESFSDVNILVLRDRFTTLRQMSTIKNITEDNDIKTPYIVYNSIPLNELFEKSQVRGYKKYSYSYYS